MNEVISRDGTAISFDRIGEGEPLIVVVGAFNTREKGAPLAAFLASELEVFVYDRRGRGESGDAPVYAVEREVEDIDALIRAAGGSASVFGYSSGAMLALLAAAAGLAIPKVVLYDLPPAQPPEHAVALAGLVGAGRRGEAVEYFQRRVVGIPESVIVGLRDAPFRQGLEAMAHTLAYEAEILVEGHLSPARVRQPTLAVAGGAGPPVMREVAEALARSLPDGRAVVLEGQTHDIVPDVLGPVVGRFLAA